MAENSENQKVSSEVQKETSEGDETKPVTDETNNACAGSNEASAPEKTEDLEDLLRTLHKQIASSDFLEKNTADKWVKENPDIAQVFLDNAKKS